MKILLNGCSFSSGYGVNSNRENDDKQYSYANILKEQYGYNISNISAAGKCNFEMFRELYSLIVNDVGYDTVIWQLTEYIRENEFRNEASGSIKLGDIRSQIITDTNTLAKTFVKKIYHSRLQNIISRGYTTKNGYPLSSSRIGVTELQHHQHEIVDTPHLGDMHIVDTSLNYSLIKLGICIHSLSNICKQKNIRLIIYNYYGLPAICFNDKLYMDIDYSCFAIENVDSGMYHHLRNMGFERPIDGHHFEFEAQEYQAKILDMFLKTNQQFVVSRESDDISVYDYT